MPSYKSIAMIKVTQLKSYAMQTLTKNWLYPQTSDGLLQVPLFVCIMLKESCYLLKM